MYIPSMNPLKKETINAIHNLSIQCAFKYLGEHDHNRYDDLRFCLRPHRDYLAYVTFKMFLSLKAEAIQKLEKSRKIVESEEEKEAIIAKFKKEMPKKLVDWVRKVSDFVPHKSGEKPYVFSNNPMKYLIDCGVFEEEVVQNV